MNKILTTCFIIATLVASAYSHGYLLDPINRASAWRVNRTVFPRVMGEEQWCGISNIKSNVDGLVLSGQKDNPNVRNVTCGIAGPIYNGKIDGPASIYLPEFREFETHGIYDLYSVEKGSPMYRGNIVKTYKYRERQIPRTKGKLIRVSVAINANHKGKVQFRICNANQLTGDIEKDMLCFERNVLKFKNGKTEVELESGRCERRWYQEIFHYKVRLPLNLTCEHCILQWLWFDTALNQLYISSADISITKIFK